jgi:hypothetical protein
MVQFFWTLALTARVAVADWALSLLSAAMEKTATAARTIKIRRIRSSNCPRLPEPAARSPKTNRMRRHVNVGPKSICTDLDRNPNKTVPQHSIPAELVACLR